MSSSSCLEGRLRINDSSSEVPAKKAHSRGQSANAYRSRHKGKQNKPPESQRADNQDAALSSLKRSHKEIIQTFQVEAYREAIRGVRADGETPLHKSRSTRIPRKLVEVNSLPPVIDSSPFLNSKSIKDAHSTLNKELETSQKWNSKATKRYLDLQYERGRHTTEKNHKLNGDLASGSVNSNDSETKRLQAIPKYRVVDPLAKGRSGKHKDRVYPAGVEAPKNSKRTASSKRSKDTRSRCADTAPGIPRGFDSDSVLIYEDQENNVGPLGWRNPAGDPGLAGSRHDRRIKSKKRRRRKGHVKVVRELSSDSSILMVEVDRHLFKKFIEDQKISIGEDVVEPCKEEQVVSAGPPESTFTQLCCSTSSSSVVRFPVRQA
eukprot:GHVH01011380.1.p1 GENE.GHVH01011380.1~~GHVH01011380.1.p1  ORF type:complete len:377 (+),score=37.88 GHVH01011380.1:289-1419(+)